MMALRTASRKLHLRLAVVRDAEHSPRLARFIANEVAIIFFRFSVQHSEAKAHGLTYDDRKVIATTKQSRDL